MSALALSCAVRTDTGPVRPHNEDAALATPRLAAVADGVGGHAAGGVASRTVVGVLASLEKEWVDEPLDAALARDDSYLQESSTRAWSRPTPRDATRSATS